MKYKNNNYIENALKNGIHFFKEKNYKKSEENLNSVLKISPNNIEALFYCGLINFQNKKYEKSKILLKKIIIIEDTHRNANVLLGLICSNLNEKKDAIEYFLKAYKHNDEDVEILNSLGSSYMSDEQYESAKFYFDKAYKIDNKFLPVCNNLGNFYLKQGQFQEAIKMYEKILRLKPGVASSYNNLASAQSDLGNLEDAVKNYCKAIEIDPKNNTTITNIIQILRYINPINSKINFITNLNNKIQKVKVPFDKGEISDDEVIYFYKNCKDLVSKSLSNYKFYDTQIWRSNTVNLRCDRHFDVFNEFKTIPEFCFGCYKVQVELKSIVDFIKLYFIFDNIYLPGNNSRKCMIELREIAGGTYKGLIFCAGIKDAKNVESILNEILKKKIKAKLKVGIKRGCTEYGIEYPDYKVIDQNSNKFMKFNEEWKENENIIDNNNSKYLRDLSAKRQPSVKGATLNDILIINNWIYYAKKIGDIDYKRLDEKVFKSDQIEIEIMKQLNFRKEEYSKNII